MIRSPMQLALAALALASSAAACGPAAGVGPSPDPPAPSVAPDGSGASVAVCRQPGGEFGAGGCAVVHGRVVDSRGRPVPGAGLSGIVIARESCMACNSPGLRVDSLGRFRQTVHWFSSPAPDSALATVRVAAVGPGYPAIGDRPAYVDSVNVVLRFAPTGAPVKPSTEIMLRLPIP